MYDLNEKKLVVEDFIKRTEKNIRNESNDQRINEKSLDTQSKIMKLIRAAYSNDVILQWLMKIKKFEKRRMSMNIIKANVKLKLKRCEIWNDLFWVKKKIYVSQSEEIYFALIKQFYDSQMKDHFDRKITYSRIARWYYWSRMTHIINRYVKICHSCRRTKVYRENKQKLLNSLLIFERYFQNISIDFIIELFKCVKHERTYEHIMMMINKLFKRKFVILNSLKVEAMIQTFLKWIWREKKYSATIIFDKETQFISFFWKKFCERLSTKFKFSTIWHSKTNEQTKNVNANLKAFFRAYVNYKQNDWVNYFFVAKFEINEVKNATTDMKFFLTTKNYLSRSKVKFFEKIRTNNSTKRKKLRNANKLIEKLESLRKFLRAKMKWAQAKQ